MIQWYTGSTVICSVIAAVVSLHGQQLQWLSDLNGENSGHTVCRFLNLPANAVNLARGTASDPGNVIWTTLPEHTAVTAHSDRYRFGFTHLEWLMGLRKEVLTAIFPVLDVGTFGGFAQLYTPGRFSNTRDIDEAPSDPSYIEYMIGASYARSFLGSRLSAGLTLAFVESRIEEVTGRTVTGSVDLLFAPVPFCSTHLSGSSFGKPVVYHGTAAEPLPLQLSWSCMVKPVPESNELRHWFDPDIGIGVRKVLDEPLIAGISTDVAAGKYLHIRAGYEYSKDEKPSIHGISAGAGIQWESFHLDGGWRYLSKVFGHVWAVSLAHEREELRKRTAEDYYSIAEKHYRKGRFTLSTFNARRALRLDPNMWKAHALLQRIKSDILRSKRREIAIIYTGNAQGNFTIPLEEGAPGGFARQATVISALRSQFPLAITLEAGNMMTPDMQPVRNSFVASYLGYIGYDAIGCGSGEFRYGLTKLIKTAGRLQIICSNSTTTPPGVIRHRIIEREGYRFFVASLLNPSVLPENKRPFVFKPKMDDLYSAAKKCDLRILIVHAPWEEIRALAPQLAGFDILVCGNLDQRFASPMKFGRLTVLSAGSLGRYVGCLTVRFEENRKISSMDNRLYALDSRVAADTAVARKISAFSTVSGVPAIAVPAAGKPVEGTFVFTSDRTGKNDLFLKVTDQLAEFPLSASIIDTCDAPVLSFAAGMIACRAQDGTCRRLLTMKLDGSGKRYVADSLQVRDARFSPDGKWLYYAAAPCGDTVTDIYRVKTEGGPSFPVISWPGATESAPVFSPVDTSMLFCSDRDGTMQLYLTDSEGELPLRITDQAANHTAPAYSPDGRMIAYLSDAMNFGGRNDLWVFDRVGGTHRRITQRSDVKEYCWLGDGRTIVYTMGAMTDELTAVDVLSFRFRKLVASDTTKTWNERSPQTMLLGRDEYVIYVRDFPDSGERQIYRVKTDGTGNTRIVNSSGRDWFTMRQ